MKWTRRIALAGIVWCAGLLAASMVPEGLPLPTPVILASALLLALPAFVVTVFAVRRLMIRENGNGRAAGGGQAMWRLLRETMPGWLLISSWLLFAGFWLVAVLSLGGTPGVPEQRAGAYVANNHGQVTVISKAQYLTLKAQDQRSAVSVAGCFCVFAAVISTALLRREERREAARP
ncbi:hypothetical protein GCE86_17610 [Micromonospora terminaliae]|uniref:Uncharacterized protein n=1 Tax=Micromonospora terminaliae TaxID=1914461 RepID=A0AAJ3DML5_9ACTN|nr:hypothetical protein [Micromonospora terminaliae]NES29345.1 hypothetical protein [Micromonospora terminaliae]QGL48678.1 hypothetical protein GCE86_17610 [Micromonospora terminaliae]